MATVVNLFFFSNVIATTFGIVSPVSGMWASPFNIGGRLSRSPFRTLLCSIDPSNSVSPLSSNTVKQLQDMCRASKLPVSGRKAELIARLERSKQDRFFATEIEPSATERIAETGDAFSIVEELPVAILACKS